MQAIDVFFEEIGAKPCVDKPYHGAVSAEETQYFLDALKPLDVDKAYNHAKLAERAKRCPVDEATGEKNRYEQQYPYGL